MLSHPTANLEDMHESLETHSPPERRQEDPDSLNRPANGSDTESVITPIETMQTRGQNWMASWRTSTKLTKRNLYDPLHALPGD